MAPDDGRVVSNFILQALQGHDLTVYGDGTQTRSFCYVDDLIEGMLRLMDQDQQQGPINVGNPVENTMLELAEAVLGAVGGSRSRIVHHPLPQDDPRKRCPDISRAKQYLNWEPQVPLVEGLRRTVEWYRQLLQNAP
jgi:UDP-glucuronate decarboxylase